MEQTPWGPMSAAEKEVADELLEETFRLQELLNTPPFPSDPSTMESFYSLNSQVLGKSHSDGNRGETVG